MWKGRVGKKNGLWVHPDLTHVLLITSLLPQAVDTALDTSAKWAYYIPHAWEGVLGSACLRRARILLTLHWLETTLVPS